MNEDHARVAAEAAVQQLRRSERGRQALADFKALLDQGGDQLDCDNWCALIALCEVAARGKTSVIEDLLTLASYP